MGEKRKQVPNRKLIRLMLVAGKSPRELSDLIDVSAPTIRAAMSGQLPRFRVQAEIAAFFDVDPDEIWPVGIQNAAQPRSHSERTSA